jgi:hypothetical protein
MSQDLYHSVLELSAEHAFNKLAEGYAVLAFLLGIPLRFTPTQSPGNLPTVASVIRIGRALFVVLAAHEIQALRMPHE